MSETPELIVALKDTPLILHVRKADYSEDNAAAQCINALKMAGVDSGHKIYLHCFVGTVKVAQMWKLNYRNTVFGLNPLVLAGRDNCSIETAGFFTSKDTPFTDIMVETDAPSTPFDNKDKAPTTPMSTYEVCCWLARHRKLPLSVVLESVGSTFAKFYGLR